MAYAPSIRMIRETIEAHARTVAIDAVSLETLRRDLEQSVQSIRRSMERAREFAARGLVCEAAAMIEDYPDLARQASELAELPRSSAAVERFWMTHIAHAAEPIWLPSVDEVDQLAGMTEHARRLRAPLDGLRVAVLRRESIGARLALLKKLREADGGNRLWLDEIETLEREWIKRIGQMRGDPSASRQELEEAFTALASRQWVAAVPRGLKEEIYQQLKPLRAEEAGDRYAELAARIHDASALMDRARLQELEAAWAEVYHETGRMPPEELQRVVAPAFEWLGRMAEDDRVQQEFDGMVVELDRALDARRPAVEIERLLAGLRDSGRSAPEGVVARAQAWIESERSRNRRRHRIALVGSMAAAAVVVSAGALAISAYTRHQERQSAFAALDALVQAGDAPEAVELAERIRSRPELATTEMEALLVRVSELDARWKQTRTELAAEKAAVAEALGRSPGRAQLAELGKRIEAAQGRAKLEEEQTAFASLLQQHADLVIALDADNARRADEVLRAVEEVVREWPLPDRWSAAEQIDPQRWSEYRGALERAKGLLERGSADVAGATVQEDRLRLRGEALAERMKEAKSRSDDLSEALAELSRERIGAPVSEESDMIVRLASALTKRGATLERMGLRGAYESAQSCGPAWSAVQHWRDSAFPVVVLALRDPQDARAAQGAVDALRAHLEAHPNSPHRASADTLIRRFDATNAAPLWTAERTRGALADNYYAELEEVPIRGGDRYFYRRISAEARGPMQRAIENLGDLSMEPARLNSMLLSPGEQIEGVTRPSLVSDLWTAAERALSVATVSPQPVLLELVARLKSVQGGDLLFRARALRDAAIVLKQSGHMPPEGLAALEAWQARSAVEWAEVLAVDWPRAAYSTPPNVRSLQRAAEAAIRAFPEVSLFVESADRDRNRIEAESTPLAPIGVLLPQERGVRGRAFGDGKSTSRTADGPVVLLVREGNAWKFVDASMVGQRIMDCPDGVSAGPVLVFRRIAR